MCLCVCVYIYIYIYIYNFIYIYTSERIKEDASILCYPEFGANHCQTIHISILKNKIALIFQLSWLTYCLILKPT